MTWIKSTTNLSQYFFNFQLILNKDEVGENESEEMEKKKEPNNSLISSLVTHKEGDRLSRRGYWGDIVTGPFIPFGHEYKKEVSICH